MSNAVSDPDQPEEGVHPRIVEGEGESAGEESKRGGDSGEGEDEGEDSDAYAPPQVAGGIYTLRYNALSRILLVGLTFVWLTVLVVFFVLVLKQTPLIVNNVWYITIGLVLTIVMILVGCLKIN